MRIFDVLKNAVKKIDNNINVENITNREIDTLFGSASGTGTNAQDYVVEHGSETVTTSITYTWNYRKWASGVSECWLIFNGTTNVSTQWGSSGLYYSGMNRFAYPSNSFIEPPVCNITMDGTNNSLWVMYWGGGGAQGTKDTTPGFAAIRVGALSSMPVIIHIYAIGRWK